MCMLSFIKHNLHLLTIFQAVLFMALLSLAPFRKNRANRFLFFFLLFLMCSEIGGFLNHVNIIRYALAHTIPTIYYLGMPLSFLAFPSLYLYVKCVTTGECKLRPFSLIHALPFAAVFAYIGIEYFSKGMDTITYIAYNNYNLFTYYEYEGLRLLRVVQIYFYVLLSFVRLVGYAKVLPNMFSSTSRISLNWLRFFLGAIGVWGVIEISALFVYNRNYYLYPYAYIAAQLALLGIITGLFLRALRQQEIILPLSANESENAQPKYQKNQLDETEKLRLQKKLIEYMQTQKPYLEPELTIKDLSVSCDIPSHYISQILNMSLQQNFYDFVNHYRIQESYRLLDADSGKTKNIIEVVYESGFNSKSTFNNAFKKHTGMTPSQYKRAAVKTAQAIA